MHLLLAACKVARIKVDPKVTTRHEEATRLHAFQQLTWAALLIKKVFEVSVQGRQLGDMQLDIKAMQETIQATGAMTGHLAPLC